MQAQQQQLEPPLPETMQGGARRRPAVTSHSVDHRDSARHRNLSSDLPLADWWVRSRHVRAAAIRPGHQIVQAARKQHALEIAAASQHRQEALHQHAMLRSVQGRRHSPTAI